MSVHSATERENMNLYDDFAMAGNTRGLIFNHQFYDLATHVTLWLLIFSCNIDMQTTYRISGGL